MTPAAFAEATGVSRETLARLEAYADLLVRWQARINLVGPDTLPHLWSRHMLDSAQLWPLIPEPARAGPLVDLGSGAGFPGLVLACMGQGAVHLIESDARKGAFLREAARAAGVAVTVHTARIEAVAPFEAALVTARALAPLDRLLGWAAPFVGPETTCLFPKGRSAEDELTRAAPSWTMRVERLPSRTDPEATILRLRGLARGRP